jgi:FdhD protein
MKKNSSGLSLERIDEMIARSASCLITRVAGGIPKNSEPDLLAIEEPLEIRLGYQSPEQWTTRSISITMRTPGNDFELAVGFLRGEGIVRSKSDVAEMHMPGPAGSNVVRVDLSPGVKFDPVRLDRNFYTTSSCGVCGKGSLDAISNQGFEAIPQGIVQFPSRLLDGLPAALRRSQVTFDETGGLHAAALFSPNGELLVVREDVGRHNAVDKVAGFLLLEDTLAPDGSALLVSGRASFELVQKAISARIPILAAVGAPSTLAVELAREFDLTLIGFVRDGRFNIYSGEERIRYEVTAAG